MFHKTYSPPVKEGVCDHCKSENLYVRKDDTAEVFTNRLAAYKEKTAPLAGFYKDLGLLKSIDGVGSFDEVQERLLAVLP